MSEEMKPCPFCGGKFGLHKDKCYINLLFDWAKDVNSVDTDSLREAWDTRTEPSEQAAKQMIPREEVEKVLFYAGEIAVKLNKVNPLGYAGAMEVAKLFESLLKETE